jgi:endonuclease/exonuclease/phosphatase family metal-dependent hydrolase
MDRFLWEDTMGCRSISSARSFILLITSVLLCTFLAANPSAAGGGDSVKALNVMTFNIRYGTANDGANHWKNRKEMVCDVLRKYRSDLVGVQEALRFQLDYIREEVPGYALIGVGREDGKTKGEYSAILYRSKRLEVNESGTFWLSDTPEIPGSITWGNACTRICTWGRFVDRKTG